MARRITRDTMISDILICSETRPFSVKSACIALMCHGHRKTVAEACEAHGVDADDFIKANELIEDFKVSLKIRLKAGFPAFNFIHLYQVKASGFDN